MQRVPMTIHGAKQLRQELETLKRERRPQVIQAIAEARAHGDLSENAEYAAAKEEQSFIEGRILEIEGKLANAQIIDVTNIPNQGRVIFGATLTLINLDDDTTRELTIVGVDEADVDAGKISVSAPIARAAIGKSVNDVIDVTTPNGVVAYEIKAVDYI